MCEVKCYSSFYQAQVTSYIKQVTFKQKCTVLLIIQEGWMSDLFINVYPHVYVHNRDNLEMMSAAATVSFNFKTTAACCIYGSLLQYTLTH